MSALSPILRDTEGSGLVFWCPGCKEAHRIQRGGWQRPALDLERQRRQTDVQPKRAGENRPRR